MDNITWKGKLKQSPTISVHLQVNFSLIIAFNQNWCDKIYHSSSLVVFSPIKPAVRFKNTSQKNNIANAFSNAELFYSCSFIDFFLAGGNMNSVQSDRRSSVSISYGQSSSPGGIRNLEKNNHQLPPLPRNYGESSISMFSNYFAMKSAF